MGINYLALNDLFHMSNERKDIVKYDIYVQMVEIYNEQVRDLLAEDKTDNKYPFLCVHYSTGSETFFHAVVLKTEQRNMLYFSSLFYSTICQRFKSLTNLKLEIRSCNDDGLSLPDARLRSVKSTTDVMTLMKLGEVNRAVSSTAINNRSSRSHR